MTFDITPDSINKFKLEQAFMLSLYESVNNRVKELEQSLLDLVKKSMLDLGLKDYLEIVGVVSTGSLTKAWDPYFFFVRIKPKEYYGHHFIKVNDRWVATTNYSRVIEEKELFFDEKLTHVDIDKVDVLLKTLTEKTGLRVKYADYEIRNKNRFIPSTSNQLLKLHPGSSILCQGKKVVNGVEEPWAILQTKKHNFMFYYSTNNCGIGYNKYASIDKKDEFFSWFGDKTELASLVSEKRYKRIVE